VEVDRLGYWYGVAARVGFVGTVNSTISVLGAFLILYKEQALKNGLLAECMFVYYGIMIFLPYTFKLLNFPLFRRWYLQRQILKPFSNSGYNQQEANRLF
jgi:hypothetical protein